MKLYNNLTNLLRAARYKRSATQKEVAEKMGIRYQQYQYYEHGRGIPTQKNRKKLAKALGLNLDLINNAIYMDERLKQADRANEQEYIGSPTITKITEKIENFMKKKEFFIKK